MCETDEELRQRYMEQLKHQQQQQWQQNQTQPSRNMSGPPFVADPCAYVSGYRDAIVYMQGKERHTYRNRDGTHVTSPAAFYLRPVPCAIVSRFDPHQLPPEDGVDFLGSTVKVLGMFGLFPATLPATANGETVEQHMLKATMFVDKDVGDQILGNVVMLAVHMYVRQCMEARIRAPYIPMVPFVLRTPISNIPMLQFVREMRVRLQTLLDAGLPRKGGPRLPPSGLRCGSSGSFSGGDSVEGCDVPASASASAATAGRHDRDLFLFEEDVPSADTSKQLFTEATETKWLSSHPSQNTNPDGALPILMMSGVNVQATPLKHSSLSSMAHVRVPAWAALDNSAEGPASGQPNGSQQTSKSALLLACRRGRFRIWVEDGRLCVWASAAYARRGCLILAQQLTLTVDSNVLPLPRSWNYRGLLRSGMPVPAPVQLNDVFILEHDIPSMGLHQGDVLRCSTAREVMQRERRRLSNGTTPATPLAPSFDKLFTQRKSSRQSISTISESPCSTDQPSAPLNYTSNHVSNVLLQDPGEAPPGAFWVHVMYDRDNAGPAPNDRRRRSSNSEPQHMQQQQDSMAYRQTNVEEVLLSWIKGIAIQTRDAAETDEHWVRDPVTKSPVRVDRYVIRRLEHDGIRYFIGVTPRFVGQQRRLEKVLGELKAIQGQEPHSSIDDGDDADESCGFDNEDEDARERAVMAQLLSAPPSMLGESGPFDTAVRHL
ncbi:hypothetical protein DQ04_11541000 [Trypanosoma grayi]|uniref:hypothetical protein n=1 Tax=Trypanosoma grayi TaxID=71804 RepID=UPI0004F47A31|nr:hypothetical protein DQ04_11541000 [Trypanosoma grayi]KEG06948.1 hypothetical protein DQ04_11541000 [Trypanosoma grayi]